MNPWSVDLITIFPEIFEGFLQKGLFGQAIQSGLIQVRRHNPRDFTTDLHRSVDDRPYGGGDGMVMMAEPLEKCLSAAQQGQPRRQVIYLSPQGVRLDSRLAQSLSREPGLILISGRYGGVDERFIAQRVDIEVSVGDYVLNGGEVAAMALLEASSRFIPGVLGNRESSEKDSFSEETLEAPLYTRPAEYQGLKVPEVLLGGHHKRIEEWRLLVGLLRTHFRRPDLVKKGTDLSKALEYYEKLTPEERRTMGLPSDS